MKGLSHLLEALAKMRVERPEMHLVVIAVVLFAAAYAVMVWLRKRSTAPAPR